MNSHAENRETVNVYDSTSLKYIGTKDTKVQFVKGKNYALSTNSKL